MHKIVCVQYHKGTITIGSRNKRGLYAWSSACTIIHVEAQQRHDYETPCHPRSLVAYQSCHPR